MFTRISTDFKQLIRVGFAVLVLGVAYGQPQAPIEWGEVRVLLVPPDSIHANRIAALGDTIVLVGTRWIDDQPQLATVCISGDNGQAWNPWHLFEQSESQFLFTTGTVTSQGVAIVTNVGDARAMYHSSSLGQTWSVPGPTRAFLRIVDTVGDTVWCSMAQNGESGITRTSNLGQSFSAMLPMPTPGFSAEALGVSDSAIVAVDRIQYGPHPYLDQYRTVAMRSEGLFSEPVRLNPMFMETFWADVELDHDGFGFIQSVMRYDRFFPGSGAVMVNRTEDHGRTWSPPDTLNPIESSGLAYAAQDGHVWLAMWYDTTVSPSFTHSGIWNTVSGNRGRSWYPRRQAIGYFQLGGDLGPVELTGSRVRFYTAFNSWDEQDHLFLQWEGLITPDTISPAVTCGDLLSGEFPFESEVTLSACATDNDSLWQMSVMLHPLTRTDSLIILLPRDHDSLYTVTFELPFDTIGWSYYYVAEDMWEHRVFLPGVDPEHPIMLSVQPDSLFPVYLQGTLIDTTLRPNQVLDFTADVVDDDSVVSVTLALWHTTVQDTYWVYMIPNLGFPYWGSWVARSDTGDWAMQYSAPDRWGHVAHYPETPHVFRVEQTSDASGAVATFGNATLSIYPNPANATVQFTGTVGRSGDSELVIHNTLGQEVQRMPLHASVGQGYTINWDLRNPGGSFLPTGMYFVTLASKTSIGPRAKLVVLR